MKNTEKIYGVKKKNILKKIQIGSGIFITSLLASISNIEGKQLTPQNESKIESYLNTLEEDELSPTSEEITTNIIDLIETEQLDANFIEKYNEVKYLIIDDREYNVDSLYARHILGGGTKIIDKSLGMLDFDIIENEIFTDYCDQLILFKDTSFFYQLYLDGKIDGEKLVISKDDLIKYTKDWNGISHLETPQTIAESKKNEYYFRKMKR